MPTQWRAARSLTQLLAQVNKSCPGRSKCADGMIGDAAHRATKSEHNPDAGGVVRALDVTNDPEGGLTSDWLARALISSRDPRIRYVISRGKIASSTVSPWVWRRYEGDPHNGHCHLSVVDGACGDDPRPWTLRAGSAVPPPAACPTFPGVVRNGSKGSGVFQVQARLHARGWSVAVDGAFGPATDKAVRAFQDDKNLTVDGVVGPDTWRALWQAKVTR